MNNSRRKQINEVIKRIDDFISNEQGNNVPLDEAKKGVIDSIHTTVEDIRDEEQNYYDEMPDGIQMGARGDAATEAIENLESALEQLGQAKDSEDNFDDVTEQLESAIDYLEAAGS